jgi:hypothetical protein
MMEIKAADGAARRECLIVNVMLAGLEGPLAEKTDDGPGTRRAIPVVERVAVESDQSERERLAACADGLLRNEPGLGQSGFFGPAVRPGLCEAPGVLIGDQREIGLHARVSEQVVEHRIALVASVGDTLIVERRNEVFEDHLAALLGIAPLETVAVGPPQAGSPVSLPMRLHGRPDLMDRLVAKARVAGGCQVLPHIGTGAAWLLAGEIARRAGVPACVAAPPPRLTRRINDKIWFAELVRSVLEPQALPPTFAAFGPAAIASRLVRLARTARKVVVKTPDSAGGEGNLAIESERIARSSLEDVRRLILSLLRARGWEGSYPVLVGVWLEDVLASPSVQIWVPAPGLGDPVIEGLFEQRVSGDRAVFVGAVPADLPPDVEARLCSEAMRLALVLQRTGYFGRLSFDALLTGRELGSAEPKWIECNGRWGGVSLPMTLGNRLFPRDGPRGICILQDKAPPLRKRGVEACLAVLGGRLLRRGGGEGVVPLSAGLFERGRGLHLAAFANSQKRAEGLARDAFLRLVEEDPSRTAPAR